MTEGFVRHESYEWAKLYKAMNKQIVVVSIIGFSHRQAAYDKTVLGATLSQFKSGLIELG